MWYDFCCEICKSLDFVFIYILHNILMFFKLEFVVFLCYWKQDFSFLKEMLAHSTQPGKAADSTKKKPTEDAALISLMTVLIYFFCKLFSDWSLTSLG